MSDYSSRSDQSEDYPVSRENALDDSSEHGADDAEREAESSSEEELALASAKAPKAPKSSARKPASRQAPQQAPRQAPQQAPKPSKAKKADRAVKDKATKRETRTIVRPPPPKPVRGRDKIGTFYRSGRTGKKCYYTPKDYESRMAAYEKAQKHSGYD